MRRRRGVADYPRAIRWVRACRIPKPAPSSGLWQLVAASGRWPRPLQLRSLMFAADRNASAANKRQPAAHHRLLPLKQVSPASFCFAICRQPRVVEDPYPPVVVACLQRHVIASPSTMPGRLLISTSEALCWSGTRQIDLIDAAIVRDELEVGPRPHRLHDRSSPSRTWASASLSQGYWEALPGRTHRSGIGESHRHLSVAWQTTPPQTGRLLPPALCILEALRTCLAEPYDVPPDTADSRPGRRRRTTSRSSARTFSTILAAPASVGRPPSKNGPATGATVGKRKADNQRLQVPPAVELRPRGNPLCSWAFSRSQRLMGKLPVASRRPAEISRQRSVMSAEQHRMSVRPAPSPHVRQATPPLPTIVVNHPPIPITICPPQP